MDDKSTTKIGGYYYQRMKKTDATSTAKDNDKAAAAKYRWADETSYHYFRYEPIKWRVLKVEDGKALLLADVALDCQKYHPDHFKGNEGQGVEKVRRKGGQKAGKGKKVRITAMVADGSGKKTSVTIKFSKAI